MHQPSTKLRLTPTHYHMTVRRVPQGSTDLFIEKSLRLVKCHAFKPGFDSLIRGVRRLPIIVKSGDISTVVGEIRVVDSLMWQQCGV